VSKNDECHCAGSTNVVTRIRSMEHGICPIAAVCTVVQILRLKCSWSRLWPFRVTWHHASR